MSQSKNILLTALFLLSVNPVCAWEKVTFQTSDGVEIAGEFSKPASQGKWTLVLLHGLGSGKEEWKPFGQVCASKGLGVLIYDARGHGDSRKKSNGE